MAFLKVQMNPDLLTEDLKKKRSSNESFWLMGQPEVEIRTIMTPTRAPIQIPREQIADFCRRYRIRWLALTLYVAA